MMGCNLVLATLDGVVIAERMEDGWRVTGHGLSGRRANCVVAREGTILAGTPDGLYRSEDGGQTWHDANDGLAVRHVRWMACPSQLPGLALAGTEAATVHVSTDDGVTWRECPEVVELRDAHSWFLPYSPEAGCVRGFASHGTRIYAAVEVGGVLRSDDGGQRWRLAEGSDGEPNMSYQPPGFVHPDVHSIGVHPSSPDWVTAPTGGGLYRSPDGGQTWACLYRCYCRAAWVDPGDPAHIVFGPADGVSRNGRIERSRDGGQSWQSASNGLAVPWPRHMVERFAQVDDELLAVLSNGELLSAPVATLAWRRVLVDVEGIRSVF